MRRLFTGSREPKRALGKGGQLQTSGEPLKRTQGLTSIFPAKCVEEETSYGERCRRAVRLGLEAFNFEWDGHVQAMTGQRNAYWTGKTGRLELRHPEVRLPARV